jgi:hypothetical protein
MSQSPTTHKRTRDQRTEEERVSAQMEKLQQEAEEFLRKYEDRQLQLRNMASQWKQRNIRIEQDELADVSDFLHDDIPDWDKELGDLQLHDFAVDEDMFAPFTLQSNDDNDEEAACITTTDHTFETCTDTGTLCSTAVPSITSTAVPSLCSTAVPSRCPSPPLLPPSNPNPTPENNDNTIDHTTRNNNLRRNGLINYTNYHLDNYNSSSDSDYSSDDLEDHPTLLFSPLTGHDDLPTKHSYSPSPTFSLSRPIPLADRIRIVVAKRFPPVFIEDTRPLITRILR